MKKAFFVNAVVVVMVLCLVYPMVSSADDTNPYKRNTWYAQRGYKHPTSAIRFKIGYTSGGSTSGTAEVDGFPVDITWTGDNPNEFSGVGGELSYVYFLNDYFALETGIGFIGGPSYELSMSLGSNTQTDKGSVSLIPVSMFAQYYPAPYGEVQPYVGLGMTYFMASSSYDKVEFSAGSGVAGQLGLDWWLDTRAALNVELRYTVVDMEYDYTNLFSTVQSLTETTPLDPLQLNVGITYDF